MVRCKFECIRKTIYEDWVEYEFSAVTQGSEENKNFFKFTPNGTLKFGCVNPTVDFIVGKEYYLDLLQCGI